MSNHLTTRSLELYYRRELPARELLEADAHLSLCAICRRHLRDRENTGAAVEALRNGFHLEENVEPEHPSYSQFTAYTDGQLDEVDREILDSHLSICAQCSEIMQDLKVYVATPPHLSVAEKRIVTSPSLIERAISVWHSFMDAMSLQMAGAAAALLLLIGVTAVVWFGLKRTSNQTEVARVAPSPAVAQSPQPTPTIAQTPNLTITTTPTPDDNTGRQKDPLPNRPAPMTTKIPAITPERPPTIALKDGGGVVTVDDRGNIKGLESLSTADQVAVRTALTREKVEPPPMLASLAGNAGVLRGGSVEGVSFPLLSPVGTVVRTDRPTLRWGALDGATAYVVSVFDENFKKVAESTPQSGTEWVVANSLSSGRVYTWHIVATRRGEHITSPEAPAPEAKFMILDEAKAKELSRAQQIYSSSHLTLGTLYARAGLLDDAEREFQMLLRDNPKSRAARRLLQSVRALRNSK